LLYAVIDGRIYRSTDRGANWTVEDRAGLPEGTTFRTIALDYRHPDTMYGITTQGIFRRQGAGDWSLVNTLRAYCLAVDLQDANTLWAGVYRTTEMNACILKSTDGGRTWGKADWGIPYGNYTTDILIDPNNPNILWAAVRGEGRHTWPPGLVYRGGRDGHWEQLDMGKFTPNFQNTDSCHVSGLAYDPNRNLLFAGCDLSYFNGGNLLFLRSPNADAPDASTVRWEEAKRWPPEGPAANGSSRPLAVDAREPRALYLGTSVYEWEKPARYSILVSHDDGTTWQPLAVPR
jgi:hypothetical protein